MKCPKCGYLAFDTVTRCRHCGFELALTAPGAFDDLTLTHDARTTQAASSDDWELGDAPDAPDAAPVDRFRDVSLFDEPPPPPNPTVRRPPSGPRRPLPTETLPPVTLFDDERWDHRDDEGTVASRRTSGAITLDDDLEATPLEPAGPLERLLARLVDVLVLLCVDMVTVYLALRVLGLPLSRVLSLPRWPLLVFVLGHHLAYLLLLGARGQSLGQLWVGIRVVGRDGEERPGLARALVRTPALLLLALPVGLGHLPMLLQREMRGLHDLLAGTRVVRT